MRRTTLGRLLIGASALATLALPSGADAQASGRPAVTVTPERAAVGDRVEVTVRDWPAGSVTVELCGNQARRGSADCAITAGAAGPVPSEGVATIALDIVEAPAACPCVIRATGSGARASTPIDVDGAPAVPAASQGDETSTAQTDVVRRLEIDHVAIVDHGDWGALFGAAARRGIELKIRNAGTVTIEAPALTLAMRRGDSTPIPVRAPTLGPIAPGETVELSVPFHLPTLSMGSYRVEGRLDGGDEPEQFVATTGTVPWGLLIVGGLVAYLVLLRVVVSLILRWRRRAAERAGLAAAFAEDDADGAEDAAGTSVHIAVLAPHGSSGVATVRPAPRRGTHIHWDAFGGVTLESILGALIDAGASPEAVQRELDGLRGASCRLDVRRIDQAAAGGLGVAASIASVATDLVVPSSSATVRRLLAESELGMGTAQRVAEVLSALAAAEAAVRRQETRGDVRINVSTLVDLVACCAALDDLGVDEVSLGPVTVGTTPSGAEGRTLVPTPTPVAAELLRRHEVVWRPSGGAAARCTAAGLGVLVATASRVESAPLAVSAIGYGADPHVGPRPSLRVMLGASFPTAHFTPSTSDDVVAISAAEPCVSSASVFDTDGATAAAAIEPSGSSGRGAMP